MKTPALPPCNHQPKPYTGLPAEEVLALRKQFLNPGIFLYYKKPIMLVEGKGQYIWDDTGKRYLDGLGGNALDEDRRFSKLAEAAAMAHRRDELLAAARALHDWQRENKR